jgi:hypothetical protein
MFSGLFFELIRVVKFGSHQKSFHIIRDYFCKMFRFVNYFQQTRVISINQAIFLFPFGSIPDSKEIVL